MFLSRRFRFRPPPLTILLLGGAATLLSTATAAAQPPIPVDARGFQRVMLTHRYLQRQAPTPTRYTARSTTSPAPRTVTVVAPDGSHRAFHMEGDVVVVTQPRYATIVGPDGRSRTFRLEGTITTVRPRWLTSK